MYTSLLPQCCVNKGSYYPSTCTRPYCHSAVSIRVPTTPLHVHVLTATVLCQSGFLLPLYTYTPFLPQCCVNQGSYYPSTCTHPYCHSAVSIRVSTTHLHVQVLTATVLCQYVFLLPLYMYKSLLPLSCVNKGYYYPSKRTSRTVTLLCQKQLLPTFHLVHILKRHLLKWVAP